MITLETAKQGITSLFKKIGNILYATYKLDADVDGTTVSTKTDTGNDSLESTFKL